MKLTRRDVAVLAVFGLLLVIGVGWFALRQARPTEGGIVARPATVPATVEATPAGGSLLVGAFQSRLALGAIPTDYQVIVRRNLFAPLPGSRTVVATGGGRPAAQPSVPAKVPPIVVPAPVAGPTRPAGPPKAPATPASTAAAPPLAFTGLVTIGQLKAVVENVELRNSRLLALGEAAWGWRVVGINEEAGTLSVVKVDQEPAKAFTLQLGEKPNVQPLSSGFGSGGAAAAPNAPGAAPGQGEAEGRRRGRGRENMVG